MPRRGEWKPEPTPPSIVHGLAAAGFVGEASPYRHSLVPGLQLSVVMGSRTRISVVTQFSGIPPHLADVLTSQARAWMVEELADELVRWQQEIAVRAALGSRVMDRVEEILGEG